VGPGRPVVTTSTGIEGIPARIKQDVAVADKPYEFSNHIVRLLGDREESNRMRLDARKLIEENFDTLELSNRLTQFYKKEV